MLFSCGNNFVETIFKFLHSIMFYINVIDMQINKGCSIKFFSAQTILAVSIYKENATFVTSWDVIIPRPSTQINAKRISTTRIYFAFLAVEMTDWMNLLCWYMFIINAMRSCSERTILHCVESYLYYIILVNKKNNSEEWNEGENK